MRRALVVATLAACALRGATALAAPTAVIVVATPDPPAGREAVRDAVVAALAAGGVEAVTDPGARAAAAIAAGAVPADRLARFRSVQETAAEGWRKYLEVAADFAAARLAKARGDAEELLALDGGIELYADVSLRLGVVLDDLQRGEEAAQAFRLARALDPAREVGLADFSPDAVAAFERAIAAQPARREVTIEVSPPGAAIEIDGIAVVDDGRGGAGAVRRVSLEVGQHVVVGRAAGYEARGQGFAVAASGDAAATRGAALATVVLSLDRDPELAVLDAPAGGVESRLFAPGTDEAAAQRGAGALLRYGELDAVLLVASVWRRGAPALIGQHCAPADDGTPRCSEAVEIGYEGNDATAAAGELVAAALAGRRRFPPTLPSDARVARPERRPGAGDGDDEGCKLCRNGWVWVGAAALAIGGGTLWVLTRDRDVTTTVGVQPGDFSVVDP